MASEAGWSLDLLAGDSADFVTNRWGSRVHMHRADPQRLVGLLSLAAADELLTGSAIRAPSIRVAQDGTVLPEATYTRQATLAGRPITGLVDTRKVLDLFDGGATIVFQGLQRYWPPLSRLIADLELALGHPCQVNAYLTPPGAQGFAVHADSHDVFVFQTHGRKLWTIHPPDNPETRNTASHTEARDAGPDRESRETAPDQQPPDAPDNVLLEPGLVLYLPTGTRHSARAEDGISLHVTVGVNQLTWRGVLRRTIAPLLAEIPNDHLPAGHLHDSTALRDGLADRLSTLVDQLRDLDPQELVRTEQERFLTTRPTKLAGALIDRDQPITDHTRLRRRGICRPLPPVGDRLRVLLGDRHLDVPGWLTDAFHRIAGLDTLTPADLAAELDEPSRLVLCRRLVREGTLAIDTLHREGALTIDTLHREGTLTIDTPSPGGR